MRGDIETWEQPGLGYIKNLNSILLGDRNTTKTLKNYV